MSKSLELKRKVFGAENGEVLDQARRLCGAMNCMAMEWLEDHNNIVECLRCLEKCDNLLKRYPKFPMKHRMASITSNGYASYWRRRSGAENVRHNSLGVQYLAFARRAIEKAYLVELKFPEEAINPAGTLINFGCLMSNEGRHVEALAKANLAIEMLSTMDDEGLSAAPVLLTGEPSTSLLAIAYHNQAVELNWLERAAEAIVAHERAVEIGRDQVGSHHTTVARVENGLLDAMRLQRESPWAKRGPKDDKVWGLVTTASRSLGGGLLRPIGKTPQGPIAWREEAIDEIKKSFTITDGPNCIHEANYEDLIRPRSVVGVGPRSLTIPHPDARSILNEVNATLPLPLV